MSTQHTPGMVPSCIYLIGPESLQIRHMGPEGHTPLVSQPQLSLGVVPATVDVPSFGQAERVVGAGSDHPNFFAEHRLHQHWLVLVLSSSESQLPLRAVAADVDMPFVGENQGVLASQGQLHNAGLFLEARGKVVFQLHCKVQYYFFGSRSVFLGAGAQLSEVALSEGKELLLAGQHHRVVVATGDLGDRSTLEKGDEFRVGQVLFVGVSQLPFVFVLAPSSPRVDLSVCVQGQTVEVPAGDVHDLLSCQSFYFVDASSLVPGLVPERASPGEEEALFGESEGVVVPAGYFFDFVLGHGGMEVELSEVIDLSRDSYFSEEQGPGHVDTAFLVDDSSVGACGCDLFDHAPESLDGEGLAGRLIGVNCQFSVLVSAPGVDQGSASAVDLGRLVFEQVVLLH